MAPFLTVRKFVTVAPGVDIYTERRTFTTTKNPIETILFIHGLGCSINTYYPIFSAILAGRPQSTLVAYDLSGFGLSPFPGTARPTPTVRDLVDDVDKLVELEAPEGPLAVIAHSAGTFLAMRWLTGATTRSLSPHISRVRSAVFIGGPLPLPVPLAVVQMQRRVADVVAARGPQEIEDQVMHMVLGPRTIEENPSAVALVRSISACHSKEGFAAGLRAFSNVSDDGPLFWERLPKELGVLFIGGRDDLSVGQDLLEGYSREVQGSQVVMIDVGHTPTVEDPVLTANAIIEFLSGQGEYHLA